MRAVIFREHSPNLDVYEIVDDMPSPVIGPSDVLINIHYAALNRLDDWVRVGWRGLNLHLPHIPGSDFAGEIAEVGDQVSGWAVGQRVVGNPTLFCDSCRYCLGGDQHLCERIAIVGEHVHGAYAEFMRLPARNLIAVPDEFDLKLAAAGNLVYLTAWRSLIVDGNLRPGETVLVVGAGGGVNIASMQLAKLAGATVWVIAGNADKAEKARALGADWVHDRSQEPEWGRLVWRKSVKLGVDLGGRSVVEIKRGNSLRSLGRHGRLLTVGGTSGYNAEVPVNLIFGRQLRIIGSTMGNMEDARMAFDLIFSGKIRPVIDSVYPLHGYLEAIQRLRSNEHFGKIVMDVQMK